MSDARFAHQSVCVVCGCCSFVLYSFSAVTLLVRCQLAKLCLWHNTSVMFETFFLCPPATQSRCGKWPVKSLWELLVVACTGIHNWGVMTSTILYWSGLRLHAPGALIYKDRQWERSAWPCIICGFCASVHYRVNQKIPQHENHDISEIFLYEILLICLEDNCALCMLSACYSLLLCHVE